MQGLLLSSCPPLQPRGPRCPLDRTWQRPLGWRGRRRRPWPGHLWTRGHSRTRRHRPRHNWTRSGGRSTRTFPRGTQTAGHCCNSCRWGRTGYCFGWPHLVQQCSPQGQRVVGHHCPVGRTQSRPHRDAQSRTWTQRGKSTRGCICRCKQVCRAERWRQTPQQDTAPEVRLCSRTQQGRTRPLIDGSCHPSPERQAQRNTRVAQAQAPMPPGDSTRGARNRMVPGWGWWTPRRRNNQRRTRHCRLETPPRLECRSGRLDTRPRRRQRSSCPPRTGLQYRTGTVPPTPPRNGQLVWRCAQATEQGKRLWGWSRPGLPSKHQWSQHRNNQGGSRHKWWRLGPRCTLQGGMRSGCHSYTPPLDDRALRPPGAAHSHSRAASTTPGALGWGPWSRWGSTTSLPRTRCPQGRGLRGMRRSAPRRTARCMYWLQARTCCQSGLLDKLSGMRSPPGSRTARCTRRYTQRRQGLASPRIYLLGRGCRCQLLQVRRCPRGTTQQ